MFVSALFCVSSTLSIKTALRDWNLPPACSKPPVVDLSFLRVLHVCSSTGGLSGFIHQAPAAGIAVPITCDRGARWGNAHRQSTLRLNSKTKRDSRAFFRLSENVFLQRTRRRENPNFSGGGRPGWSGIDGLSGRMAGGVSFVCSVFEEKLKCFISSVWRFCSLNRGSRSVSTICCYGGDTRLSMWIWTWIWLTRHQHSEVSDCTC